MRALVRIIALTVVGAASGACGAGGAPERDSVAQSGAAAKKSSWDSTAWRPPSRDALGNDSLSGAIRRGHALIVATAESLPRFVGGNLDCQSRPLHGRRAGTGGH